MKIDVSKFEMEDTDQYEEFINNIFIQLKRFEKVHSDFKFKMTLGQNYVLIKTIKMNESAN